MTYYFTQGEREKGRSCHESVLTCRVVLRAVFEVERDQAELRKFEILFKFYRFRQPSIDDMIHCIANCNIECTLDMLPLETWLWCRINFGSNMSSIFEVRHLS